MAILEATNLRKSYRLSRTNTVEALRGVDLSIGEGEMVAIMGPSGCGKSTLMYVLGLLHSPDQDGGPSPELRFAGQPMTDLSETKRTRLRATDIGFVFQSFNLVLTLTAVENVALAAQYAAVPRAAARTAALECLDLVGLADRADHRPAELSGGEQQRIAIARALVNRPKLVIGDEPTGNLDSARTADVLRLLRKLNQERRQTFLIVTHDAEVGAACDRTIWMRDGRVVEGSDRVWQRSPSGIPTTPPPGPLPTH
jgi:putative ABC transport system ATP-binding protein